MLKAFQWWWGLLLAFSLLAVSRVFLPLPFIIEVTGEGQGDIDESYHIVKVSFSEVKEGQVAAIQKAIAASEAWASARSSSRASAFSAAALARAIVSRREREPAPPRM